MNQISWSEPTASVCLKNISNSELIARMQKLVRTERKITHLILLHIAEIEERKLYAELGYDGMYTYLTRGLGYSDGSAYRRLHSARLMVQVPEVAKKIESGCLNLSQLSKVQKCLKISSRNGASVSVEQTMHVLEKIEHKNTFETEKTLAKEMNLSIEVCEVITPQRDDSVRLVVTLSRKDFTNLELAKCLLSHICPDGTWAGIIGHLASAFIKKKFHGRGDVARSVVLAEANCVNGTDGDRSVKSLEIGEVSAKGTSNSKVPQRRASRNYISVGVKRTLFQRAGNCCEFVDPNSGVKCQSSYQLQIDHILPFALGGSDDIENLRVLCRTHNLAAARQLGIGGR